MIGCRTDFQTIEGVQACIVTLEGACVHDGRHETMATMMERAAAEHDVVAVIVDMRGIKPMRCHCASSIQRTFEPATIQLLPPSRGAKAMVQALEDDWDEDLKQWLAVDIDAAADVIARRLRAGEHVVLRADGSVSKHVQWSRRGTVVVSSLRSGEIFETLWVGRRRIEIVHRPRKSVVDWRKQWPFPDAAGDENEACRLQAHVRLRGTAVVELDFSPAQTGHPRPQSWLQNVRSCGQVEVVDLSGTETNDADVASLMNTCPAIVDLRLDRTAITDLSLRLFLRARELRSVHLKGCRVTGSKVEELQDLRPELWVDFDTGP